MWDADDGASFDTSAAPPVQDDELLSQIDVMLSQLR
jgi:hypothetical protein